MEQHSLSEQQYEQLVDLLHRCGLVSPKLITEMADHFSEKGLELMAHGYTWERVLSSFKTKKIFLELRRTQAAYTANVEKTVWEVSFRQMVAALHPKYLLLYLISGMLSHYLIATEVTVTAFQYLLGVKNALVVVLTFYVIYFHKDFRLLVRDKYLLFSGLFIIDYLIFLNYTGAVFSVSESLRELNGEGESLLLATALITLSVYCNVVAWRVFQVMRAHVSNTHPSIRKVLKEV